mmetsp:Transcript_13550/g.36235  ORF Transcript_13550/g.36235 Transcript_13550/m.36235 type:complete len:305 (-) Transcript_13550:17-931(-)
MIVDDRVQSHLGCGHVGMEATLNLVPVCETAVKASGLPTGVHGSRSRTIRHIVAAPARGVAATACGGIGREARRAMDGIAVEGNHISRLHVPAQKLQLTGGHLRLYVRELVESIVCSVVVSITIRVRIAREVGDSVHEAPLVRTFDVAYTPVSRHLVERHPERADLIAVQMPVGCVVVPRRRGRCAGFLHEELVVEDVSCLAAQNTCGDGSNTRGSDILAESWVPHPKELVVVKAARDALSRSVLVTERTGLVHVCLRSVAERLHPGCVEHRAKDYRAILGKALNVRVSNQGRIHARERRGGEA